MANHQGARLPNQRTGAPLVVLACLLTAIPAGGKATQLFKDKRQVGTPTNVVSVLRLPWSTTHRVDVKLVLIQATCLFTFSQSP